MSKKYFPTILLLIVLLVAPSINFQSPPANPNGTSNIFLAASSGNPQTQEIEISKTHAFLDIYGVWNVIGLATNLAEYPVGEIEINIEIFDVNQDSLYSENIIIAPLGLAPGTSQPFAIKISADIANLDHFEFTILQSKRLNIDMIQLSTRGVKMVTQQDGVLTIIGEILNNSERPVMIHSIWGTVHTVASEIYAAEQCQVCTTYLPPGESGPFQILIYGPPLGTGTPTEFEIFVTAEATTPIAPMAIAFIEPVHSYSDQFGNFQILGEVQNQADQILDLRLLAAFYDLNGQIVGASVYDLPLNALIPGESSPYDISISGNDKVDDWSIQVDLAGSRQVDSASYVLTVSGEEQSYVESLGTFTGQVLNDTDKSLNIVLVVIGLRDKGSGKLVGLAQSMQIGDFPSGSTIEYSLAINPDPQFDPGSLEAFVIACGR